MLTCSISRNLDDGAKCIQGTYQDSLNLWDGDVMLLHKLSYLTQYDQISYCTSENVHDSQSVQRFTLLYT